MFGFEGLRMSSFKRRAQFRRPDGEKWIETAIVDFRNEKTAYRWLNDWRNRRAACGGQMGVVTWLYSECVLDPRRRCYNGRTVAHEAASSGKLCVLKWLHFRGTLELSDVDAKGWTVAHFAAWQGQVHILRWLHEIEMLQFQWNEIARLSNLRQHLPVLKWMHSVKLLDASAKDADGTTMAHFAAKYGDLATLKWLHSEALLDATELDRFGQNVSLFAASCRHYTKALEILQWLHSQGLLDVNARDYQGRTLASLSPIIAQTWLNNSNLLPSDP